MGRTKNSVKSMYERVERQQTQKLQSQIDDIQTKLHQIKLSERKQQLGTILDKQQLDEMEEKDELQSQLFRLKNELQKSQRAQSQAQNEWSWGDSNPSSSISLLPNVPKNYICKNCKAKGIHWIMRCDKVPQFIPIKVYQDTIVDFKHIQEVGIPYNCPFCTFLSFDAWYQWKIHWYKYHNDQYFQVHQSNLDRKQMGMYTIICCIYFCS